MSSAPSPRSVADPAGLEREVARDATIALVIWGAVVAAVVLFDLVGHLVTPRLGPPPLTDPAVLAVLRPALAVGGLLCAVGAHAVRALMLRLPHTLSLDAARRRYRHASIVAGALAEMIGMFGLALALTARDFLALDLGCLVSLLVLASVRPRRDGMVAWLARATGADAAGGEDRGRTGAGSGPRDEA